VFDEQPMNFAAESFSLMLAPLKPWNYREQIFNPTIATSVDRGSASGLLKESQAELLIGRGLPGLRHWDMVVGKGLKWVVLWYVILEIAVQE
jgi:hypothetical protein